MEKSIGVLGYVRGCETVGLGARRSGGKRDVSESAKRKRVMDMLCLIMGTRVLVFLSTEGNQHDHVVHHHHCMLVRSFCPSLPPFCVGRDR